MTSGHRYKILAWIIILLCSHVADAQKKFIRALDTVAAPNTLMTEGGTCAGETELDPYNIDYDLINCLLIQEINHYRKRRHLRPLEYDIKLDLTAQNYLNYFHRATFIANDENRTRINYPLKKATKKLKFKNGLVNAIVYQAPLVTLTKRQGYFYYANGPDAPLNLYYGAQPEKNTLESGTYVFEPVKLITYNVFVKSFFKTKVLRTYHRAILDKAMRFIGCRCRVITQTLYKKNIPAANFMIVVGGKRLDLLPGNHQK